MTYNNNETLKSLVNNKQKTQQSKPIQLSGGSSQTKGKTIGTTKDVSAFHEPAEPKQLRNHSKAAHNLQAQTADSDFLAQQHKGLVGLPGPTLPITRPYFMQMTNYNSIQTNQPGQKKVVQFANQYNTYQQMQGYH